MCNLKKYLLALLLLFFFKATPFSFDGRVTPTVVDYRPTLTNGDYVWGAVIFYKGFDVAPYAIVNVSLAVPVFNSIYLGRISTLKFQNTLEVSDGIIMDTDSNIIFNISPDNLPASLDILNGTITATTRGHIYQTTDPVYIKTYGHNLGNSTIIIHVPTATLTWDFSNGPISCGSYRGGHYESEYGLFFKGDFVGGCFVYLRNATFSALWQNTSGVPEVRFSQVGSLFTDNVDWGFFSDNAYTFSGINGWVYPTKTTLGVVPWRVLDYYPPNLLGDFEVKPGLTINFKNAVALAPPGTFNSCDLNLTSTLIMLYPAFTFNGNVNINGQNKPWVDLSAAHIQISPGSKINVTNCSVAW
ncbi:MAG: hypothetical protein C0412_18585 [Flavobacterium sp.]|nr:hypothetical protein [Flavobacterium sp.]